MEDEHVMETLGKATVVIKNGKVVSVSEPKLSYCPLFHKYRSVERITRETIKENIESRIREFGLFTENRDLEQRVFVGFGTSEIFMSALKRGNLDTVVCVCEGAGTVISSNPVLIQGIGARLSGLVSTTPIPKIIEGINRLDGVVLDPGHATIDQKKGVLRAIELGHEKIGVTLTDPRQAKECKEIDQGNIVTFLVHTSGINSDPGDYLHCDLITACASKELRESLRGIIKAQAGSSIPIFALSQLGKELLLDRAKDIEKSLYLSTKELPVLGGRQPEPLF